MFAQPPSVAVGESYTQTQSPPQSSAVSHGSPSLTEEEHEKTGITAAEKRNDMMVRFMGVMTTPS
jgi:hypothetical protein